MGWLVCHWTEVKQCIKSNRFHPENGFAEQKALLKQELKPWQYELKMSNTRNLYPIYPGWLWKIPATNAFLRSLTVPALQSACLGDNSAIGEVWRGLRCWCVRALLFELEICKWEIKITGKMWAKCFLGNRERQWKGFLMGEIAF